MKPVPTRLVKVDAHNIAVEYLREVEVTEEVGGKRVKTGKRRKEWQEERFYGHRLDLAAKTALFEAIPKGAVVTPELIQDAVKEIVKQTKDVLK